MDLLGRAELYVGLDLHGCAQLLALGQLQDFKLGLLQHRLRCQILQVEGSAVLLAVTPALGRLGLATLLLAHDRAGAAVARLAGLRVPLTGRAPAVRTERVAREIETLGQQLSFLVEDVRLGVALVRKRIELLLLDELAAELVVGRRRRDVDAVGQRHAHVRERRLALGERVRAVLTGRAGGLGR